ncbi:unnamed protein product [Mytilus edulis]|uniref:Reverse transcriptase/retrotransposon-derived protein RNase H-like domain-containing protein n=1 Tax=Mytilus edulis TaxID=6550 RepID=A0A8S3R4V9_MYTED|nr:unnamed protein product [Mytilus edulis]
MTAASDFQTNEKEDLDRKRVFFQRQYDESSGILLQIDNLLQESHDVTFFTDWKRLKTDVQNLTEIDQTLQNPKRIESFNEDNFMKAVMEEIDKRLTRRKKQKFVWTEDCQQSFEELKTTLVSAPFISYPTREDLFILDTDGGNVGMRAVLFQLQDGVEKVICYVSKTLSRLERKYCVSRRELLAVANND